MNITDSFDKVFASKSRILVVLAHPDDAEIYAGGTIARLTSMGKVVRVVKVTSGDRGSKQETISQKDLRALRHSEDEASMKILGIKPEDNVHLGIGDGRVTNSLKTIGKIAFQIRQFKPDLIITHNPQDLIIKFDQNSSWVNHRDHRNTGKSTIDAAYPYSRDLLFFPKHFETQGVDSHQVADFLFVDYYHDSDTVYFEITDHLNTKINSITAHKSQYSAIDARESSEFFSKKPDGKNYECFKLVITD